jgi:hypothetical protein
LEDAAIQIAVGYYRSDAMDDEDLGTEMRKMHASILLAVVKAADLDIDRICWGEMRRLCALWVPEWEAVA